MKTVKLFATLLLALFVFAACDSQVLPDDEWEKDEEVAPVRPHRTSPPIYISQDLESDLLLRKEDKEIRLSPDSGSFTISLFFRQPFTYYETLRDELHISSHEIQGDNFLRLKSVRSISKLEAHYTYEYTANRSDVHRFTRLVFMDVFNMPSAYPCYGSVNIDQPAYASDE